MPFVRRLIAVVALLAGGASRAPGQAKQQGGTSRKAGEIEGDVYLVMQSGDAKKAPGQSVFLIHDTPLLRVNLMSTCQMYHLRTDLPNIYVQELDDSIVRTRNLSLRAELTVRRGRLVAQRDSAASRVIAEFFREIGANAIDTTSSGVNAHYRFKDVVPGEYVVFGQWTFSDKLYQWWAPVAVTSGSSRTRDLDNSVEASRAFACGIVK